MLRLRTREPIKSFFIWGALALLATACGSNGAVDKLINAPGNEVVVEVPQDLQITVTTPAVNGKNVGYEVYMAGGCTLPGGVIEFRGSASGFSVCQGNNTWTANVDVSGVATTGSITVEAYLVDGTDESAPATRTFNKENTDCNSVAARAATNAGGAGTLGDPYRICTTAQFNNIRTDITANYILKNELDLQNVPFAPVPNNFSGSLDGNNYTIRNLYIYDLSSNDIGIFKNIRDGGFVKNLDIENANVSGPADVGIVAGRVFGTGATFQNITVTSGRVSATSNWVGGLIGRVDANSDLTVSDCTVDLSSLTGLGYGGGLLGGTQNGTGTVILSNITTSGSVTLSTNFGGGIVGIIDANSAGSSLTNIDTTANVTITGGTNDNYAAGIVGRMDAGDIDGCTSTGLISATGSYVAGVVGSFSGTKIWNCTVTSPIQVDSNSRAAGYVGGVVGYATTAATNLYNLDVKSDITVTGANVSSYFGGIGGRVFATTINTCSAHGDATTSTRGTLTVNTGDGATTGSNQVGGAFGRFDIVDGGTLTVSNCDSDVDVTNVGAPNSAFTGGFLGYSGPGEGALGSNITITNSTASGDVVASNDYVGGYAGYIYLPRSGSAGILNNVHATGNVTVTSQNSQPVDYIGGLAGALLSRDNAEVGFAPPAGYQLENIYATGDVSVDSGAFGGNYVGGLVGYFRTGRTAAGGAVSLVTNTYATGNVEALTSSAALTYVGGLFGRSYAATDATVTIDNSGGAVYASGNVSGQGTRVGGLIGQFDGTTNATNTLQYVYSNGNVSGDRYVGGLIGFASNGGGTGNMLIDNVKSHDSNPGTPNPTVTATNREAGGLIGYAVSTSTNFLLSNCQSISNVTSAGPSAGGLIGADRGNIDISSCYASGNVVASGGYGGGLTGGSDQTGRDFSDVHATGDVTMTITGVGFNNVMAGGLVGYHRGTLSNATATGDVNIVITPGSSITSSYVGGLIGYARNSVVDQTWAKGSVSYDTLGAGATNFTGGLIGYQNSASPVTNSFALGDVVGGNQTGGLIGRADGTITNAMAEGNVSGTQYVGGLIGYYNYAAANGATIVYSLGSVSRSAGANVANFGQIAGFCNAGNNGRVSTTSAHYNATTSTIEAGLTAYAPCNTTTARDVSNAGMLSPGAGFNAAFTFDCSGTASPTDWCYPTSFAKKGSVTPFLYPIPYWATP